MSLSFQYSFGLWFSRRLRRGSRTMGWDQLEKSEVFNLQQPWSEKGLENFSSNSHESWSLAWLECLRHNRFFLRSAFSSLTFLRGRSIHPIEEIWKRSFHRWNGLTCVHDLVSEWLQKGEPYESCRQKTHLFNRMVKRYFHLSRRKMSKHVVLLICVRRRFSFRPYPTQ